jgi:hypothetical protein
MVTAAGSRQRSAVSPQSSAKALLLGSDGIRKTTLSRKNKSAGLAPALKSKFK